MLKDRKESVKSLRYNRYYTASRRKWWQKLLRIKVPDLAYYRLVSSESPEYEEAQFEEVTIQGRKPFCIMGKND